MVETSEEKAIEEEVKSPETEEKKSAIGSAGIMK